MLKKSRSEIIQQINASNRYDLVVIGGGIHGAVAAKQAVKLGLKTILLEKSDYASGTSSRSSKMAHGGLRYLEMFDFKQVFEGIKARDNLFINYPNKVKPYPFYIPVYQGDWFFKLKLGIGLKLYDLMLKDKSLAHRWVDKAAVLEKVPELASHNLAGCYQYTDGIMTDYQLVIDNILEARSYGADCLNYAVVKKVNYLENSKQSEVRWQDAQSGEEYQLTTKAVINCAGPWFSDFNPELKTRVRYSRGSHLIFSKPWNKPALFLPMEGKARYYFVWPHSAGTMVGTTEQSVDKIIDDPIPSKEKVQEILDRLKKDLPDSGLNQDNLHYAFAGVRTLPLRGNGGDVSKISRKHIWHQEENLFSLIGGKFTTSEWTIKEVLAKVVSYLDFKRIESAKFEKFDLSSLSPIELAFNFQQAVTLEDFMRRRSGLEYQKGAGLAYIAENYHLLKNILGEYSLDQQIKRYQQRIKEIQVILNS